MEKASIMSSKNIMTVSRTMIVPSVDAKVLGSGISSSLLPNDIVDRADGRSQSEPAFGRK